jgi:hypothetical protein
MAAGPTYEPIATTTLGTAAASVTFSSISGSYTDLILVAQVTTAAATNMRIRFNNDSASNYSITWLGGTGSAANTGRETGNTAALLESNAYPNGGSSSIAQYSIHLNRYSNTNTWKTFISRAANAGTGSDLSVGLWRSTSAINEIQVRTSSGGNISVGSTFTLYGIAAA